MKEIATKISPPHGAFKFRNLTNARSFAERGRKAMVIVLGDDQLFGVMSLALGEELTKSGYELAE